MASPPSGYRYDVFISYKRMAKVERWIDQIFLNQLRDHLELELGRVPQIFLDRSALRVGDVWKTEISTALRQSRCLVAVLSASYFRSTWCVAEWETFRIRAELERMMEKGHGLAIPIRWHDGDSFPKSVRSITEVDFTNYAVTAKYFLDSPLAMDFEIAVGKMCEHLAQKISAAPDYSDAWPVVDPDGVSFNPPQSSDWSYKLLGDDT